MARASVPNGLSGRLTGRARSAGAARIGRGGEEGPRRPGDPDLEGGAAPLGGPGPSGLKGGPGPESGRPGLGGGRAG